MSDKQNIGTPVKTVTEFLKRINEIVKPETQKESKVLFRGQENEGWKVETSAYRRLKEEAKQENLSEEEISEEDELYYNFVLIQQFKHADFHSDYKSKIMQEDLGILAQLQHQGAATSLIDFTDNAMTALWFACKKSINSDSNDNNNGKVFILSTGGESKFDEIDSIEQIENSKVRLPGELDFGGGNNILNNTKLIYWKPAHLNNRITAQQSYFLISKREPPKMQEIIIDGNSKIDIMEELSTVHGIDGTMLFPDLVGFAQANSVGSAYGKEEKRLRKKIILRHHDEIIEKINKEPNDTETNKIAKITKLAEAYHNQAIAKYKLNDYQGAIDDFTKIIKNNQNDAIAYHNRAYVKHQLGNAKYGIKDYQGAIDYYNYANDDYQTALKYSKAEDLTESINEKLQYNEKKLKELQDKLLKDKE